MTHIPFERLSELADANGGAVAARDDEARHIAACGECRGTLSRVRALLVAARTLPRAIEPPAEAWSGIRSRVAACAHRRGGAVRWGRWVALAAGIVFVVGTAVLVPGGRGKGDIVKARPVPTVASSVVTRVDMRYQPTLAELRATLEEQRAMFGPAAVRVVDQSLAVIDTALSETRAALASDPHNPTLVERLSATYQRKVELLQRATELARSS